MTSGINARLCRRTGASGAEIRHTLALLCCYGHAAGDGRCAEYIMLPCPIHGMRKCTVYLLELLDTDDPSSQCLTEVGAATRQYIDTVEGVPAVENLCIQYALSKISGCPAKADNNKYGPDCHRHLDASGLSLSIKAPRLEGNTPLSSSDAGKMKGSTILQRAVLALAGLRSGI